MASRWKLYSPEGDWTFEGNLNGRLLYTILSVERGIARWRCHTAEVPLNFKAEEEEQCVKQRLRENKSQYKGATCDFVNTFGDAVLCRQEPLLQKALQDGADRGPVDQLQHKQVRLREKISWSVLLTSSGGVPADCFWGATPNIRENTWTPWCFLCIVAFLKWNVYSFDILYEMFCYV